MANKQINIGNRLVGNEHTFVIAEVGSNHATSLETALESIDAAAACGADAVKFQSLNVDEQYLNATDDIRQLHKKIDLDEKWYSTLKQRCDEKKVVFMSAPTYLKAVELLENVNVAAYKLASAQIGTFSQIIRKVAQTGKPAFFSTGIADFSDIRNTIRIFEEEGNKNYIIFHCSSIYPLPYERVNLPLMNAYAEAFDCLVGYSDHTEGSFIAGAAVARGAKAIEKHFTLSRSLPTPDAFVSMEPPEFRQMIEGIRATEKALRSQTRVVIEPEEAAFRERIRHKLILKKDKKTGESFTAADFHYLRTTRGIDSQLENLVTENFSARTELKQGAVLQWNHLNGKPG